MKESNLNMINDRINDKEFNIAMHNLLTLASCNSQKFDWNEYMKAVDDVDNYIRTWSNENATYDGHKLVAYPTNKEMLTAVIDYFKDSFIHQCVINDIL